MTPCDLFVFDGLLESPISLNTSTTRTPTLLCRNNTALLRGTAPSIIAGNINGNSNGNSEAGNSKGGNSNSSSSGTTSSDDGNGCAPSSLTGEVAVQMQGWPDWAVTLLSTAFVVPAVGYVVIPLLLLIFSRWVFQPHRQATGLCGFLERGFPCC